MFKRGSGLTTSLNPLFARQGDGGIFRTLLLLINKYNPRLKKVNTNHDCDQKLVLTLLNQPI
jgi:hypothetical protein